ncbi:MAG: Grx4 family monothiol glutaredoxin [Rickettsiaceae bacterium H1]|nr:Grx4 family monothiol glutaredoxin [Rickettsiaceae bacterium H1]
MEDIFKEIKKEINENKVVLFMKGSKFNPLCGFSATVVNILQKMKITFKDIDVLQKEKFRQGIKDYSNWLTIPQLYINGKFIGGADIVQELYSDGELEKLLYTVPEQY